MRYGTRILMAVLAVMALTVAPAAAEGHDDGSSCEGLERALTVVKNDRARQVIQAKVAERCIEEPLTPEAACASVQGSFIDDAGAVGSGFPVDWSCTFRLTADLTPAPIVAFLTEVCAGNLITHSLADSPTFISDCWF